MESRFYGGIATATVLAPAEPQRGDVAAAYAAMATAGTISEAQRQIFHDAADRLMETDGAEAILLGGTDLALAFDSATCTFPLVHCAAIHVDAIAAHAIGKGFAG